MIFWCSECQIPYYSLRKNTCSLCDTIGKELNGENLIPVFLQEKKLLSHILNRDVTKGNVWYKGNSYYLINGNLEKVPYVEYYKSKEHVTIRDQLRNDISYDTYISHEKRFLDANEKHISDLIFEAENYITNIIEQYKDTHFPAVSFSGGKDSIVASRVVRECLQDNGIIHFMADTTLELPDTYHYYKETFRHEKWQKELYDFARKTDKTDIEDYIVNDRWKSRKGASGLKAKNIDIVDTECSLDINTRNIIVEKPLTKKIIEYIKPFGRINIEEKGGNVTIGVKEGRKKIFEISFKEGSKILKVSSQEGYDMFLLIKRLKCQIRKYQFCIFCSACQAVCPQMAISTIHGEYRVDENKCNHCKACIGRFYNGCLMSEVLAEKKN